MKKANVNLLVGLPWADILETGISSGLNSRIHRQTCFFFSSSSSRQVAVGQHTRLQVDTSLPGSVLTR